MTADVRVAAIQDAFWQTAEALMLRHTNPWELDEALTAWGYGIGPCAAQDLFGLDKVLSRLPARPVPILPRMVAEGRLGKLGGVGYYRYPGGGGAVIDPLIEDLIREEAWFAKVPRHEVSDAVLVERMNTALYAVLPDKVEPEKAADLLTNAVAFPNHRLSDLPVHC